MEATYPTAAVVSTEYAGFWRRFVALVIDIIILVIVNAIISAIISAILMAVLRDSATSIEGIIIFVLDWIYFAYQESSAAQATIGKRAMGIKVTDLQGNRISFLRATGRYFAKIVSGIIIFIGYVMAAFTAKKQALHDMLAGTLVVKAG